MANFKFIGLVGLFFSGVASAGFVDASPPPSWTSAGGQGMYGVSKSDISFANGIRSKILGASVNVAGAAVEIPVAYKFASTAGRAAASLAFGWPGVFLLAGGLAYQYFTDAGFKVVDGIWQQDNSFSTYGNQQLMVGSCGWYNTPAPGLTSQNYTDIYTLKVNDALNCNGWVRTGWSFTAPPSWVVSQVSGSTTMWQAIGTGVLRTSPTATSNVQVQIRFTKTDNVGYRPVSQPDFEDRMATKPVPFDTIQAWPDAAPKPVIPVEAPILNPDANVIPAAQTMRVPQGSSQAISGTDPVEYQTPVIDIVPAPTATKPWNVELQEKFVKSLTPMTNEPKPITTSPVGTVDPNATPKTDTDICVLHPEILACAKPNLDTPTSTDLTTTARPLTFTPDSGWLGGSGFCPAPRHIPGANIDIPFTMVCDFMTGIKPVLLAVAALAAGMIIIGARGGAAE